MELLNKLNWRYAAKAMNGQKVPREKIDNIIEAISLAATSSGLQPFEVFVITNQEIKEKIKPIAWNQSVITDCSHLLVFALSVRLVRRDKRGSNVSKISAKRACRQQCFARRYCA